MKNPYRLLLTGIFFLYFAVILSNAQAVNLAELSRQEKERKKNQQTASVVLNNDNLSTFAKDKGSFIQASNSGESSKTLSSHSEGQGGDMPGRTSEGDQEFWKNRKKMLADNIENLEKQVEKGQSDINHWQTQYLNNDVLTQKNTIKENMDKAANTLKELKEKLNDAKMDLEEFYEEARKKGIPPGWIR
jgi:hypothetical protein